MSVNVGVSVFNLASPAVLIAEFKFEARTILGTIVGTNPGWNSTDKSKEKHFRIISFPCMFSKMSLMKQDFKDIGPFNSLMLVNFQSDVNTDLAPFTRRLSELR